MKQQIKARLTWVNLYIETKDAGYVCRKCGIFRPTLRKWYKRYLEAGIDGLNLRKKLGSVDISPAAYVPRLVRGIQRSF